MRRRRTRSSHPSAKQVINCSAGAARAVDFLRGSDPVLARIIAQVGPLAMTYRRERFQALVRAIVFQQLAGRAAMAIFERFAKIVGGSRFPTAQQVLAASDEELRRAGLSRAKMASVRDLAAYVCDRRLDFRRLAKLADEQVIEQLVRVRGIGRWTAEMFLMFNLRRPDVLPVDDLGLRNAVAKAYGLAEPPAAKELKLMGERWRPYRSAAVWYFWQSARRLTPEAAAARPRARQVGRRARPRPAGIAQPATPSTTTSAARPSSPRT